MFSSMLLYILNNKLLKCSHLIVTKQRNTVGIAMQTDEIFAPVTRAMRPVVVKTSTTFHTRSEYGTPVFSDIIVTMER